MKTIQQIKQPSFANSIIVRDDGTFDAQIDIPKNWQPDSQHVIEAQAVGQDGHAQTQVQQTVTMPAESSGGVLSSPTPTPTPTLTPTPTPTPTLTPTVPPSAQLPVVSNLDQKSGPVAGGTTVTISGSGFIGATSFSFGKAMVDCAVSSCKVNSDGTQITVTSPVEDSFDTPGPVDVIVTTSVGHSAQSSADQFTYIPLPIVTGINPSSGSPNGGTPVTINGSGFTNATVVSFDSTSVIFNFVSDSQITATSPAGNGIVDVTVTTPGGTSQTNGMDTFTYDVAPVPDPIPDPIPTPTPTPTVSVLGG